MLFGEGDFRRQVTNSFHCMKKDTRYHRITKKEERCIAPPFPLQVVSQGFEP